MLQFTRIFFLQISSYYLTLCHKNTKKNIEMENVSVFELLGTFLIDKRKTLNYYNPQMRRNMKEQHSEFN